MTKQEELIKSDITKEAQYIGEDGEMVVSGKLTRLGAWRKMIARLREDCGEVEAYDFITSTKPEDLGTAYFHLIEDAKNKEDFDNDCEWYISTKDESPYEVWTFWG